MGIRTRNENVGSYPSTWRRISYRVKRLHGFRCERCKHPWPPSRPPSFQRFLDLWEIDWRVERGIIMPNLALSRLLEKPISREIGVHGGCDEFCTHKPEGLILSIERGSEVVKAKWRCLTTHHLDGNKPNVKLWNLAALCQVCHLQIQAKVCWDQAYIGDHTSWMQWHIDRYRRDCERLGIPVIH